MPNRRKKRKVRRTVKNGGKPNPLLGPGVRGSLSNEQRVILHDTLARIHCRLGIRAAIPAVLDDLAAEGVPQDWYRHYDAGDPRATLAVMIVISAASVQPSQVRDTVVVTKNPLPDNVSHTYSGIIEAVFAIISGQNGDVLVLIPHSERGCAESVTEFGRFSGKREKVRVKA